MISVVIPFYNEQENIIPIYDKLSSVLNNMGHPYEITFVDDGSTDNTFEEMMKLEDEQKSLKIVKFRKNFGQSAALKAGFDHATGDLIISMDGDLQNDPADIPKLIDKITREDYDVVCGWRADRKDTIFKKLFSRIANFIRHKITSEPIHDSGCTFRVYKHECVKDLELYGELHRYIPAMLFWKGYKIGEVEVQHHSRKFGYTKYNWKRLIKGFLDLIVISFWQKYAVRPIHVFGGLGLLLTATGVLAGGLMGIQRLFFGISLTNRPMFLLSILLIILGVQFIVSGIIADIVLKVYYGQNGRKNYLIEKVVE
ncbi:MAG: hypothetical protein PWQ51_2416 [Methanolobus sp.]|nr:hypothetical protein [Methanolobus sp.]MDK2940251.1 hypothetical protein [Methanolobus sp.]